MDNREYFDKVASQWDQMRTKLFSVNVRETAMRIAGVSEGKTAADIGAGSGFISEGLLARGLKVIAVDHSQEMLEVMRRKFPDTKGLEVRLGDSVRLPLDDASVDYVFANMYLHHVEDPPAAILEMVRILKPSGALVITDADEHNHEFLRIEQHDRWLGFKHDDLRRWYREAGLAEIEVRSIGEKCRPTAECGTTVDISIFAASGRKRVGE